MTTLFITGIDTEIGKSVACGALANTLLQKGYNLFTQKWVETGCENESLDLKTHQDLANKNFNLGAKEAHAPYLFEYPASPHLSAELAGSKIEINYLIEQTRRLESGCDHLIIEGAGGLCVPLTNNTLTIDLIARLSIPVVLVTSARLGSINHTILSLKICQEKSIEIRALIYNHFPKQDQRIVANTRDTLQKYLFDNNCCDLWLELPENGKAISLSETQITQLLC
ncbi:MAG: dethiobiotin synthase [Acidiferrobacterales bacterium]|nr:dethiobiotin synthase [Acidiferrobacterales bacterium]